MRLTIIFLALSTCVFGQVASISPVSLSFGTQNIGTTSAAQVLTFSNIGFSTMNISSIAVSGASIGDFAQTNTCAATLAAGANCTISVTFTPTIAGARSASITVTSNASNSPTIAGISGTGIIAFSSLNGIIVKGGVIVH